MAATATGSALPDPPGRVGPYRLEKRLGRGGMGAVYRAFDTRLERWVAVKQLLPEVAGSERQRRRFRREARSAAQLNHPAVVQIFDFLEGDDGDWIVMELVEGSSLRDLLRRGPLEIPVALRLGRQIAEGLAAAHAEGLIHRDLKVENVVVTPSVRAKILDFGLAKSAQPKPGDPLSQHGTVVGTSRAMSPEQVRGESLDARSDLFSLGTLLYEALTARSPFLGESSVITLTRVLKHRQTPARWINSDVPKAFSDLVDRLLEKDPDRRPLNADAVVRELRRLAESPAAAEEAVELENSASTLTSGLLAGTPPSAHADLTDRARPQPATGLRRWRVRAAGTWAWLDLELGGWKWPVLTSVLLATLAVGWADLRREPAPRALAADTRPVLAVVGFRDLSPESGNAWMANALTELLATELASRGGLRLVPGESLARLDDDLVKAFPERLPGESLRRLRQELGADVVVLGSYRVDEDDGGRRLEVRVMLQDAVTGELRELPPSLGTESDLFALTTRAGNALRRALDLDLRDRPVPGRPPE